MRRRFSPGFVCRAVLALAVIAASLGTAASSSAITGEHRVLVVLCNFQGNAVEPKPRAYYEELYGSQGDGKWGAYDFWSDVSYGKLTVDATVVGWYTIPASRDDWYAGGNRDNMWKRCAERAAGDVDYGAFLGVVVVYPEAMATTAANIDANATTVTLTSLEGSPYGNFPTPPFDAVIFGQRLGEPDETVRVTAVSASGNTFTIQRGQQNAVPHSARSTIQARGDFFGGAPGTVNLGGTTYILGRSVVPHDMSLPGHLHEQAHLVGIEHSWSLAAGEYGDCYDTASVFSCTYQFQLNPTDPDEFGTNFGGSIWYRAGKGPGFNSVIVDNQGWLPAERKATFDNSSCRQQTYTMAALNHPEASGFQQVRVGPFAPAIDYLSVELRNKSGWDKGIPANAFLLHAKLADGRSQLIDRDPSGNSIGGSSGRGALTAGSTYVNTTLSTYVAVNSVDTNHTGRVTLGSCKLDTALDYVGVTSGQYSDLALLSANLGVTGSSAPIPVATVTLSLGSQSCAAETDASGHARCAIELDQVPGAYMVTARFAGTDAYNSASDSASFTIEKEDTVLTYAGVATKDYHDALTASGMLLDDDDDPVPGRSVSFQLGASDSCSATTNASGVASCSIVPSQAAGTYALASTFAGDAYYESSSDSDSFEITHEESTTTFTGPTVILAGSGATATLKAQLVEDGANDDDGDGGPFAAVPSGQTIAFALGSQTCSALTNASGIAQCNVSVPSSLGLGPQTVTSSFAGDAYYRSSSDSDQVIVFAFPSRGAFVLGDNTVAAATSTSAVTWWDDAWWRLNSVSGGVAPDSFKGFAGSVATLPTTSPAGTCGTTFRTLPGNSPPPTSGVPSYMGVLVASSVTKAGNAINGRWGKIVVVRTDAGYAPSPGRPGTGTIVATFCP
jgi:hypothetical protein